MFTRNETAPAGGTTAARAEHLHLRTPASKTDKSQSSAGTHAGQLSPGVARYFEVVRSLSDADRETIVAMHAASLAMSVERDLTPKQAAHELGVSPSTVRRLCASGDLGRRHIDRWRIDPAEVRAIKRGSAR